MEGVAALTRRQWTADEASEAEGQRVGAGRTHVAPVCWPDSVEAERAD